MAGTMKIFCIRMIIFSHRKKNLSPCKASIVQQEAFSQGVLILSQIRGEGGGKGGEGDSRMQRSEMLPHLAAKVSFRVHSKR